MLCRSGSFCIQLHLAVCRKGGDMQPQGMCFFLQGAQPVCPCIPESAISYVDGEKGILEYRGIPVELLAEKSTFLEVAYLLLFGKLPNAAEYKNFQSDITYHTRLKVKILRMIEFLPENGHPMEYLQSVVAAMGIYYPARDVMNEEVRYSSIIRLIAKMPTIVAACERLRHGDAPIPPNNDLSFAANF